MHTYTHRNTNTHTHTFETQHKETERHIGRKAKRVTKIAAYSNILQLNCKN